ncbi:DUF2065 domain-containing protein [Methylophaga sp. OBS1]|uniref:DUF2065 domain-containing protein n=1 Tax=Methylophaga sp. OBS1 TaxID=2991933 RepID=UPI00224FEAB7|nr:DUF2065 domain-containing protein [Methylophaga sp. OBS1]MCX4194071.1 DUF2065 domain-containing protein [Methylophaga sp. OBS1]
MNPELLHSLWVAMALMLIIEGIMPFLSPQKFKRALLQMAAMPDRQVRLIGFFSMLAGLIFLYWIN